MSFRLNRPSSPSDGMLSPCSKSLLAAKKSLRKPIIRKADLPQTFTLESQLQAQPCPAGNMRLILGTASHGRRTVVETLGWNFEQISADIDEKAIRDEDPIEMPVLIAKAKAAALIKRHDLCQLKEPALLITCDQIVLFKTVVREKPEDRAEAVRFLSSYSNDAVSTVSAVVITHLPSGIQEAGVDIATVYWKEITPEVVERVVDRGETLSCAGGFMIEDPDLLPLVKGIDRPVDSVMGMPVDLTKRLMVQVLRAADCGEVVEAQDEHKNVHK